MGDRAPLGLADGVRCRCSHRTFADGSDRYAVKTIEWRGMGGEQEKSTLRPPPMPRLHSDADLAEPWPHALNRRRAGPADPFAPIASISEDALDEGAR